MSEHDLQPTQSLPASSQLPLNDHSTSSPADEPYVHPPSLRLLFSLLSRQRCIFLVVPAMLSSIIAGGIAPFMTVVIGQSFNALSKFPVSSDPPEDARHQLMHSIGIAALELVGLAAGSFAMSAVTSSLWIWTGEYNVMAMRKRVYEAVSKKEMDWFDTKMDMEGDVQTSDEEKGPLGAGGLMAQFSKETDDVRMASSLTSGMLLQYMTTALACLGLAFQRSWSLSLVILSTVPTLVIIQGLSQTLAGPCLAAERNETATAATLADRAIRAIATVKAFNASEHEHAALSRILVRMNKAVARLNTVWGITSSLAQFVMMAMFVQGFWFGSKLVREHKAAAGDVMAVFWACLIATSNLQMCIPQLIILTKGKFAMASALTLADSHGPHDHRTTSLRKTSRDLRKIRPIKCYGEFALHHITFTYPSRPSMLVLRDVSIFLPANEMTFIVGGSGSGKSTIAQLLLRMYEPHTGIIQLDEQDVSYLDENWLRQHVAGVSQDCILFDMSVHDNVAMGLAGPGSRRNPEDATREEVIQACRAALMHEFIRDLPEGYDTKLGNGGANLSGGQKQRLAIARAWLRNPTILILDEATSALDATSRVLVFEAIKRWRVNKTTIVITHDLSQITPQDFVYVLKSGCVVEQGYRNDLEKSGGEFAEMMEIQDSTGGYLPEKDIEHRKESVEDILEQAQLEKDQELEAVTDDAGPFKHQSIRRPPRRTTAGNWLFADFGRKSQGYPDVEPGRISGFIPTEMFGNDGYPARRPSSSYVPPLPAIPKHLLQASRRLSLPSDVTSEVVSQKQPNASVALTADDEEFETEKVALSRSGTRATERRRFQDKSRLHRDDSKLAPMDFVKVERPDSMSVNDPQGNDRLPSVWQLIRDFFPTIPDKPILFMGCIACVISGAMTPVFSFLLSRLIFEVSIGASQVSTINLYGGIVLGVAAVDGLFMGLKYFIMETVAQAWITQIRKICYELVLTQDKKWFDRRQNSAMRLVQVIMKDGDDARLLIAVVLSQLIVLISMLTVGLTWALVEGWQLTLVGFAIAPVFAGIMALQAHFIAKCELRNKRAREAVAKGYYETISNIRGIRSMSFEGIFKQHFDAAANRALSVGVRGAFVEGCTYGVANGLIYLAEALLFYVSAILIARGTYTYLQMVEVLNLVVFSVTIGSQLMSFTQKIAKSMHAARDLHPLLQLSRDTDESQGEKHPNLSGRIVIDNVSFAYPERPNVEVLKKFSIRMADGECAAIVGASGSGKSTVAALLQRLYEAKSGKIRVGHHDIKHMAVNHLREHVSVVSQNPNLFDATISENISYGSKTLTSRDIRRAAKAANVHEFIKSLPQGYDTMVGENASLISGGQAQRLQIARALARPSKILILDECTSALDPANQAAVLETIRRAKVGRTTLMITHKLPVMRLCDRIFVIHEGELAEQGSYGDLMSHNGVFAKLARAGEWDGE